MKESFIVYHEIAEQTAVMTDEQVGQLFRAMICFSKGGEPEIDDPFVALAFSFVKPTMERDRRKYEAVCEQHREAGRKGGRPRKGQPTGCGDSLPENQKNQMVFEKPDNVPVYVHDPDNEPVREDVPVSVSVLDCPDEPDGQTADCDTCEQDFQDALTYAKKAGYQFTAKQRKKLRQWCKLFPFESVIMAFDRAIFHGGKSTAYVFRILQEWQGKHLFDPDAITAYLAAREGGGIARAV